MAGLPHRRSVLFPVLTLLVLGCVAVGSGEKKLLHPTLLRSAVPSMKILYW